MGTDCICQVLTESQWVRIAHTKARATLLKARVGSQGTMAWSLHKLRLHLPAERQGLPWAAVE